MEGSPVEDKTEKQETIFFFKKKEGFETNPYGLRREEGVDQTKLSEGLNQTFVFSRGGFNQT